MKCPSNILCYNCIGICWSTDNECICKNCINKEYMPTCKQCHSNNHYDIPLCVDAYTLYCNNCKEETDFEPVTYDEIYDT